MTETALMDPEPDRDVDHDGAQPVGWTAARHRALLTVRDDRVRYDLTHARWLLRVDRATETLTGSRQRTLRDLLDLGLIEHYGPDDASRRVRTTARGDGALALWGERSDRM